ncbi:MOSC domain-containing protein [Vibrio nitrifigilis]|uniref:MOSC domain-containing protein n=1 Tax=Vibrio nitrifigilis TaxID=2789781 RepID=A0ABS0GKG0_9VIBR|nr:MOSC domain-containing protein [Vibrio nitrifigilis]MBF9002955.1 MOSC domain-containing protein [Vibrio nitrifigilis]
MKVVSLSKDSEHRFSKETCDSLTFLKGLGIEGDAHCGDTVKHRSRVKADPSQPNLRQVHLVHSELISELQESGFTVEAGTIGENVLTEGVELLSLPRNTLIMIGAKVVLRVTGLRNPCAQLDNYQRGLTKAVLARDEAGNLVRKAGIMAVVEEGGIVNVGDSISVQMPPKPYKALERV